VVGSTDSRRPVHGSAKPTLLLGWFVWLSVACSGCGGVVGSTPPSGGGTDTVPPSMSAISSSPNPTGATISWTTNEPSDSQAEFGTTTNYGQSTSLSPALLTNHSVSLNSLVASTLYHFRVRSRDAAGNLATSGDFTFTTTAAPDTTPPVISSLSANGITATSANIAWATNEAADSQVEYGTTTGYGQSTPLDSTRGTTHTVPLTGLASSTLYHYRAKSRDAAGNLATSGDAALMTAVLPDTTPPTVSITSPVAGAAVSGTITLTANASDNKGVAGVKFKVDGTNSGAEDTTAPYSASLDTTALSNGSHAIAAEARDAAGNHTTSAGVTVTVNNGAPPPGGPITIGQVIVDPPTLETIGVSLPILSGDTNYNAKVQVFYRKLGDTAWNEALPLLRVRPENLSTEDPSPFPVGEQFAGSIFDLQPDTLYDVRLEVQDPDGGNATKLDSIRTRSVPLANPATPRVVNVSNMSQLQTALSGANPGDIITLANGTYGGAISVSRSGTAANPIFVRGQSQSGVILDATGSTYGITVGGTNVTVENLTVRSSSWGMRLASTSDAVVRRVKITNVFFGIDARGGTNQNYYICDNTLEGKGAVWPDTSNAVWDFEGIVVTGSGHVVCYNTLSGFGDALGLSHDTAIPNRAIDFYGNEVLWTGDNGVEMDFTERNVRVFRNRFTNGGNHSISFQPIWGGPAYAFRNVIYNSGTAPYKLNNDPTGFLIFHNTAVRPGWAWGQYGGVASNFQFFNNITVGTTDAVDMSTDISLAQIDYDGWLPDGQFRFTTTWVGFNNLRQNSPYEHHGLILNGMPFAAPLTIPVSYTTFVQPLDASLTATSNAIDTGARLPNINDTFTGNGPDLGALERGLPLPWYGVRPATP
jgi:hypothetical protein